MVRVVLTLGWRLGIDIDIWGNATALNFIMGHQQSLTHHRDDNS